MGHHNSTSESIEMYLLRIALLQQELRPVPIPRLAQELSVSPVSANEMCRKLTDRALIDYEPYKGVTLTIQGEVLAQRVLRHRRLWEVFFVDNLGLEPHQAEEFACRFEHVTPDELANRLDRFLEHPRYSPQNEPIPACDDAAPPPVRPTQPLTALTAGQNGQVVDLSEDRVTQEFLEQQGISVGVTLTALAVAADGALLLDIAGQRVSVAAALAQDVHIILLPDSKPEADVVAEVLPVVS